MPTRVHSLLPWVLLTLTKRLISVTAPDIKRIGKYEVIDVLGRGGMGLVCRAFDQLNREVAIKTLSEGFTDDQSMLKRSIRKPPKRARSDIPTSSPCTI